MTTNSRARRRTFATVADSFAGLTDPSMGDERERDIILRAGTTAMTASIYAIQVLGVFFALIGVGLWSGIALIAAVIPSAVYTWYSTSSGLDSHQTYAKIARRRRLWTMVAGFALALAWVGAVAFHMITGSPILDVGVGSVNVGDASTANGMLVGAVIGGVVAVIALSISARMGSRSIRAEDEDDED